MGQWLLPDAVATDFICVKLEIPNTHQDIRNFLGQLLELGYFYLYEHDGTNLRNEVAEKWVEAFANTLIGACMEIRISPTDNCVVESSNDGGETWSELYDMSDCVLSSILGNQAIRDAISSIAQLSNIQADTPESVTALALQLVDNQAGCDNDNIYGMVQQLVEFADRLIRDIFEQLDAANQAMDNLAYLISAIPVVESLPLDEAIDFGDWLIDQIEQQYIGASTTLLKTTVACDLFCIAQDNGCLLTMEDARDYFYDQLGLTLDTSNPTQFLEDLIINNLVGNAAFYGMYTLVFQIFAFGGIFASLLPAQLVRMVQAMFNDPNPDWATECDDCPDTWSFDSSLADSPNIWEVTDLGFGDLAEYVPDVGFVSVDGETGAGSYSRIIRIQTSVFSQDAHITGISFNFDVVKGLSISSATALAIVALRSGGAPNVQNVVTFTTMQNGDNQTMPLTINTDDVIQILILARCWTGSTESYAGSINLDSVHVSGEGFNPFE